MNKAKKYKLKLDYTADELKELKELGKDCNSPMNTIYLIVQTETDADIFRNLRRKYRMLDNHKEFDFMADINNVVMGTAIFPQPKKYYVHFVKGYKNGYLNVHKYTGEIFISTRTGIDNDIFKTAFTDEEIKAIDPRLVPFMEEVEK